jgi:hypothetical protein
MEEKVNINKWVYSKKDPMGSQFRISDSPQPSHVASSKGMASESASKAQTPEQAAVEQAVRKQETVMLSNRINT